MYEKHTRMLNKERATESAVGLLVTFGQDMGVTENKDKTCTSAIVFDFKKNHFSRWKR